MTDLLLEAGADAREEFERFVADHAEQAFVQSSSGSDGASMVHLIIENAPALSASIALLVASLQKRTIKFKASRDGVELDLSDVAKPT